MKNPLIIELYVHCACRMFRWSFATDQSSCTGKKRDNDIFFAGEFLNKNVAKNMVTGKLPVA
jgi:hypothetical protein